MSFRNAVRPAEARDVAYCVYTDGHVGGERGAASQAQVGPHHTRLETVRRAARRKGAQQVRLNQSFFILNFNFLIFDIVAQAAGKMKQTGQAGGITQSIGAFAIDMVRHTQNQFRLHFADNAIFDTPGNTAFSGLRQHTTRRTHGGRCDPGGSACATASGADEVELLEISDI